MNRNGPPNKNSCLPCARRKVKCDKLSPCTSCSKARAACIYRAPVPSQRHRKRLTQSDLLSKIQELETLLRNHSIPFDPLANSWIHSTWEEKFIGSPPAQAGLGSPVEGVTMAGAHPAAQAVRGLSGDVPLDVSESAAQLWSGLSEDLKEPPISQLKPYGKDVVDQPTHNDTAIATHSILNPAQLSAPPGQLELHPDPKHVFKLWQTFADNVNPLTKIIHAPTLQERIFETAWTVESAAKPLEATMFAVYALAVASMKPSDCIHVFGEARQVLVSRYRLGAMRALSGTDLLSTRDFEVLQALTLVLMIDPQSELSITAVALALRIAHKIGLHRASEDSRMPFFKQEMQVRLWWYIRGLNSRARRGMGLLSTIDDLGDARLPMNVNDADLHPRMVNPPAVQHTAATEMVYCLMKYDLWTFVRKSSNFSNSLNPREKAAELVTSTSPESIAKKKKVLGEVDRMLQGKYLAQLDPSIPLHRLSAAMASITIHHQRFLMFHPRHQPEGGRYMSQADQDLVFESSVRLLEMDHDVRNTSFSIKLVDHMACRTQVEALVFMVSELRRRTSGPMVETAWALLGEMYDEEPVMLQTDHKFYSALVDLTLVAWEARWRALELRAEAVPKFMERLRISRGQLEAGKEPTMNMGDQQIGSLGNLMHDEPLDWTYWHDFLEL